MQNRKVSIIITSYNQAQYITRALDSALSQDYPDMEVLLGDDGSSDATAAVIKPYLNDKRVKYIKHQKKLGQIVNRRKLLYQHAEGAYILQLDGDDFLIDNSYISEAVDLLTSHQLALVFAKNKVLIQKTRRWVADSVNNDLPAVIDGNWLFLNYHRGYSIPHSSVLFEKQPAQAIGFLKHDYYPSWDWDYFLRLAINNQVGFINKYVSVWRKHDHNITKNFDRNDPARATAYIDSLDAFAQSQKVFAEEELASWKTKMLQRVFFRLIITYSLLKQRGRLVELLAHIKAQYGSRFQRKILFDIRLIMFRLLSLSDSLTHLVFKYFLGQESFYLDLVAERKGLAD